MPDEKPTEQFTVFVAEDHTTVRALVAAVRKTTGPLLLVATPKGTAHLSDADLTQALAEARALNKDRRLVLASKDPRLVALAEQQLWHVIKNPKQFQMMIASHPQYSEAQRAFSPVWWRKDIRSRLQFVGLLSLPKLRIWGLFLLSGGTFLYVFLKLLPSATIAIWPNQQTGSFTTNVYLAQSGASLPVTPERVRILPLKKLTVKVDRSFTFDQISKTFTGKNAEMTVIIYNDSTEPYSLRKLSRIVNQAGMRFRIQESVTLPPKTTQQVEAVAEPIDQYGEVLGARGNVPANVKWDFLGLSEHERTLVYARNPKSGTGGTTQYVTVVTKEDMEGSKEHAGARQVLEQQLLNDAKQQAEEDRQSFNALNNTNFVQLNYEELTSSAYSNFQLSDSFIGQQVASVPVAGSIQYSIILYDEDELLQLLTEEVRKRVQKDKLIVESSLTKTNMTVHVIPPWDDDFQWVKITADLRYIERYVLSPLTPEGATFGKGIRDSIAGKDISDANRIIQNLPEVAKVEISVWPPWTYQLPEIGSNIVIKERE